MFGSDLGKKLWFAIKRHSASKTIIVYVQTLVGAGSMKTRRGRACWQHTHHQVAPPHCKFYVFNLIFSLKKTLTKNLDMWHPAGDMCQVTGDTWHMTHDIWHMTQDKWHVTCDTWHIVGDEHSLQRGMLGTLFWIHWVKLLQPFSQHARDLYLLPIIDFYQSFEATIVSRYLLVSRMLRKGL